LLSARLRGIYAIVDGKTPPAALALLDAMLAGGVRLVQYRSKSGIDRTLLRAMLARTRARDALLIVNDDFEAALEADGWHAGQEDLAGADRAALRARLGSRVLGISCGTAEEARQAGRDGADYIGVGPFAQTQTKLDAGDPLGAEGLRTIVAASSVPVAAIGGIGLGDLGAVAATGAAMAAVVSAIAGAPDPESAAHDLVERWALLVESSNESPP